MARPAPTETDWRGFFDGLFEARRLFVDAKLDAINEKLNVATENIKNGLDRAEDRINERFTARDRTRERADANIEERFQQIYAFRDLLNSERSTYVTRDQLETTLKAVLDQIDILKRTVTLTAGRDTGASRVWTGIAMAFGVLGTIIAALSLILHVRP